MENYNPFSLKNKTILITGASSGIGRAIAIECSKMGAVIVITGRNANRLHETFTELDGDGHKQIIADVTNENEIISLVQDIPILDGVVHCSGIGISLPFQFCKGDKARPIIETNLISPISLSYQLVKMKKLSKKGASIIFISSIAGHLVSYPGNSIYSASKAGLIGLTKGMSIDLAAKNIRVNAILPGMIETQLVADLAEKISQEAIEIDKKKYPLGCYGKPEDVANGVIYLLSDASKWITGTNLVIDGGFTVL